MQISEELRPWLTLVFLSIIWGSSFFLIKKALVVFSPVEVALLRILICGWAFLPYVLIKRKKLDWSRWPMYLMVATTGSALPVLFFALAQTHISSAVAGALNSMTPIFTLIIGIVLFRTKSQSMQIIGILIGFTGASILVYMSSGMSNVGTSGSIIYPILAICGSVLYATNINFVKRYFQDIPSLHLNAMAFSLVGAPFLLVVPFTSITDKLIHDPRGWECLGYLTILALVSTVMALIIFYQLVQNTSAVFASSVAYLIPVVALAWGMLDGEIITMTHILALGLIVAAVYLIKEKRRIAPPIKA